jgi:hypothetical protein
MLSTEWVHEKDERSFNAFMFASFSLVEKNKESEKLISLEKEDNIKLVEIDVEITKIDSSKDDKKLHDHIVAQMTERAIENNQNESTAFWNQTTFLNELRRDRNNSYISTT